MPVFARGQKLWMELCVRTVDDIVIQERSAYEGAPYSEEKTMASQTDQH